MVTYSFHFLICLNGIAAAVELGLDTKQNYQEIGGKQEHSEIAVTTYYPMANLGVVLSSPLN